MFFNFYRQQWLLGVVVAVILPAIGYKGGIFALLKGKLDEVVNTTERVAEAVASVAEEAEKIAEEVESNLPADSNIKKTLDSVEDMANKVIQDAKIAEDAIQKVKDVEEEIEKEEEKTQQKLT
ncbi:hypothetical protein M569_17541 [Genlisea aurea]|uniref:Uncharacterized protein n=1 Tax=Genlisea aurea TaxID=192259 RepID=S8BRM7_9LAMI|nr:hypothetical protein M569_17541 [Genlisea aurea]